jgi:DNA-directed RNA polymerase specialized sigma24 family protein
MSADLSDLLIQMKITNRLLAAQLRGSMGQKELIGLLMSTGASYGDIADVLDTTTGTVKVTALRIRRAGNGRGAGKGRKNG